MARFHDLKNLDGLWAGWRGARGVVLAGRGGLALLALTLSAILVNSTDGFGNLWATVGLAVAAVLAERGRVTLRPDTEVSISLLPTVFAAAVLGPLSAMVVAAASFACDFPPL